MQKILLCLVLCMLGEIAHADAIVLEKSVKVRGFSLLLSDIARVHNENLAKIYLGATPPLGETYFYDRAFVMAAIKREGINCDKISLQGAQSVKVETQSASLSPEDATRLAEEYIRLSLPWKHSDVRCRLTKAPEPLRFPAPRKALNIEPSFLDAPKNRGPIAVRIAIVVDGRQAKSTTLSFRVAVFQNAYFTRGFTKRRTRLQLSLLCRKRVEITEMNVLPIISPIELHGKRCRYNLPANHMIAVKDLEDAPLIPKGTFVHIVVKSGNLRINIPGKALQDGRKGETIKVRNLSSRKPVKAKVIDESNVLFDSGN